MHIPGVKLPKELIEAFDASKHLAGSSMREMLKVAIDKLALMYGMPEEGEMIRLTKEGDHWKALIGDENVGVSGSGLTKEEALDDLYGESLEDGQARRLPMMPGSTEKLKRVRDRMARFKVDPDLPHDGKAAALQRILIKVEGVVESNCPYAGVLFKDIPDYDPGYGCPVCKGLSYHLDIEPGTEIGTINLGAVRELELYKEDGVQEFPSGDGVENVWSNECRLVFGRPVAQAVPGERVAAMGLTYEHGPKKVMREVQVEIRETGPAFLMPKLEDVPVRITIGRVVGGND